MTEINQGAPPSTLRRGSKLGELGQKLDDLVIEALARPGEWFSVSIPKTQNNIHGMIERTIGANLSDVTRRDNRIYLRIKP